MNLNFLDFHFYLLPMFSENFEVIGSLMKILKMRNCKNYEK